MVVALLLLAGCHGTNEPSAPSKGAQPGQKISVLATTGMIADAARRVGGEHVDVTALMGPGVDPHLYQPTARDQGRLQSARIVLYNGLHLEGKMVETFETLAKKKTVVAVSRDITQDKLLGWASTGGLHDPHIWFDVTLWQTVVKTVAAALSKADPAHRTNYDENCKKYLDELEKLHAYCQKRAEELPQEHRLLITSHDAFHYFGRAYGFQVVGIQGISTETEAGLKAITDAVDLIKKRKLAAIFPESSVPKSAIARVANDSGVKLGPELFSDALGAPDSSAGTYAGMIRTNIDHIVDSLRGK